MEPVKAFCMHSEFYPFLSTDDGLAFYFESVSERKTVRKVIAYRLFPDSSDIYNLSLADIESDGSLSDLTVSNNSDMPKVLSTVVQSMFNFFKQRPAARVYFQGSTEQRTRLYRIVITREISESKKYFEIYGVIGGRSEPFVHNRCYEGFLISNKKYENYD